MPANKIAIAPDIPIKSAVPKSGCFKINARGMSVMIEEITIKLIFFRLMHQKAKAIRR